MLGRFVQLRLRRVDPSLFKILESLVEGADSGVDVVDRSSALPADLGLVLRLAEQVEGGSKAIQPTG